MVQARIRRVAASNPDSIPEVVTNRGAQNRWSGARWTMPRKLGCMVHGGDSRRGSRRARDRTLSLPYSVPPMPPCVKTLVRTSRDVSNTARPNGFRRWCVPFVGKGVGSDRTAFGQICSHNTNRQSVALDPAGHYGDSFANWWKELLHAPVRTGAGPNPLALTRMLSPRAARKTVCQDPRCVAKVAPPSSSKRWLPAPISEDTHSVRTAVTPCPRRAPRPTSLIGTLLGVAKAAVSRCTESCATRQSAKAWF